MCEIQRIDPEVHDALASHADDYAVRRALHRVPPHVTYEVEIDGTRAVCKLATHPEGDPATEARVIQHVEANTSVPVPEILAVGKDYFVAAWHDGVPQEAPQVDETVVRTMGAGLATLHEETAFDSPGFLRVGGDGLELDARETWHAVVCEHLAGLQDWLEPHGYDDAADVALAFVREHPDLLAGCGDSVLCHGNYLPDHVGTADGALACLIDFEHAVVGPGEYDFWRAALPTFYSIDRGIDEGGVEAFRAGYESVRPLPDGFDDRREIHWLVNMVSYFQSLFLQRQVTGEEARRRAERMREHVFERVGALSTELD